VHCFVCMQVGGRDKAQKKNEKKDKNGGDG